MAAVSLALSPPVLPDAGVHDLFTVCLCTVLCTKDAIVVHAVFQMLVEDHDGIVPQTFEELEKLPGVGHKTASVVICTAFGYAAVHSTSDVCKGYYWWNKQRGWTASFLNQHYMLTVTSDPILMPCVNQALHGKLWMTLHATVPLM